MSEVEYLSRLYGLNNERTHFGIVSNSVSDIDNLGLIDPERGALKRIPLPEFEDLKDYAVTRTRNGQISVGFGPRIRISQSPEKIILSSDYANKFYIFIPIAPI